MNGLLHAVGGALAGTVIGCAVAYYGTRHITARSIHQLEAAGNLEEAQARRAVLLARAGSGADVSAACQTGTL